MSIGKLLFMCVAAVVSPAVSATMEKPVRSLQYFPDGKDFVSINGTNRYTRALYGGYTDFRVETSDRPIFGIFKEKMCRNVRFWITSDDTVLRLDSASYCEARYSAGMRTYTLTDRRWKGGRLLITVLAAKDREQAIWRFEASGFSGGTLLKAAICDIVNPKLSRSGDLGADRDNSFDPAAGESRLQTVSWNAESVTYVAVECAGTDAYSVAPLDSKAGAEAFGRAMKHREWLASLITVDTPDPWINAAAGVLVAAADGAWDGKTWLHGSIGWRTQLPGWRAGYLGDVLGLPGRALSHFDAYAASQVNSVPPVIPHPAQDPGKGLSRALKKWGTQMYSDGYICRAPGRNNVMHHYDMNLNYVDELLWHFCYDADTAYMRRMWPLLKAHLAWEKRNYDPDDDGLYDAYCCIWASDALYYNSGAVTHSSAYNYRGFSLAARIAEIIGENPSYYRREAEKTLRAMNTTLWLENRGHWAEYKDFMGLRRIHADAAVWSVYTPIDCGAASDVQMYRATQYVDSCLPHIPVTAEVDNPAFAERGIKPITRADGYYTISTTDWMPYDWSINNVAPAEVMHTALAYFLAGRPDGGFRLLKSNILDQMFIGRSPGNYGQISYYDKARGESYRDFSDVTGVAARTFVEGLFGVRPDALNGRCVIRPGFPAHWNHAELRTPYIHIVFRREGNKEIYTVEQSFSRPLRIVLRLNDGAGYTETAGTSELVQTFSVDTPARKPEPRPLVSAPGAGTGMWGNTFDDVHGDMCEPVDISGSFNACVTDIFRNKYLSPRSPYTTLQIPVHGIGQWCHPETDATIDDSGLRSVVRNGLYRTSLGIPFLSPAVGRNIIYTSLFDNYPQEVTLPLEGHATHAYLMMAGSTNHMQYRMDNAVVTVAYADGTADSMLLRPPFNWCPIEQDYYEDGLAYRAYGQRPYRFCLSDGEVSRGRLGYDSVDRRLDGYDPHATLRYIKGGAGVILDMPLDGRKQLKGITLRTLSNDVVVGLMGVTLQR